MLRQLLVIALAVAAGAVPMSLPAQPSPTRPAAGQRVRLHLVPPSGIVDGTVLGWAADTLVLGPLIRQRALPDTLMRLPRTSIVSYQPNLGRDHSRGFVRGAKRGAAIGGGIGLIILFFGIAGDANDSSGEGAPGIVIGGGVAVFTTLAGTLIGAVFGSIGGPDRWGNEQRVALREYPGPRRFALALSLAH
jgi:membrane associated rhomboid family serine protease